MNDLYPLKFEPIFKEKIWGGNRLNKVLGKETGSQNSIGESWELSGVDANISVVANGFLAGNDILELIEIYMGDLLGDSVYEQFGIQFPLLIKFIDANQYLSIQVHPNDELALERHQSYGKTEAWYIVDSEKDAELIIGFNQEMDKQKYLNVTNSGKLRDVLNIEKVQADDMYFIPAGLIHATGPGILFAEIQQTSDLTYRIYDWDRLGNDGKPRELHTDLALDAIDFTYHKQYKTDYISELNKSKPVVKCPYFTINIIECNKKLELDYIWLDSFVILMGIEGNLSISYSKDKPAILLKKGETVLLPAILDEIVLIPESANAKVLEVYIDGSAI